MGALGCTTCRIIRRFLLAFAVGGGLAWQMTGSHPFQAAAGEAWQGIMWVAVLFSGLSIFIRMRHMRGRWRR